MKPKINLPNQVRQNVAEPVAPAIAADDARLTFDQSCEMLETHWDRLITPGRWAIALRRAEKRGDDLRPLVHLLLSAETPALNRLGKLLQQRRLTRLPGRPYSVFRESKTERMLDAVQLVRDMQKGVAGSLEDLRMQLRLNPGETRFAPIDGDLPAPQKLSRDEAIREVANLTGIEQTALGNAVAGRSSYLRRGR